ncbi:MAG: hypothetical protein Q9220_002195 [cf. Caloplaca sp. 1 TL-2023]
MGWSTYSLLVLPSIFLFALYRLFFHPLSKVPGPWIASLTSVWHTYHSFIGDEWTFLRSLHQEYGRIVRIGPNEVDVSDGAALAPVYVEKGGFLKAPMYDNFHVDGFHTISTTTDPEFRAVRAKAVTSLFSPAAIRKGSDAIEQSVARFVHRLRELKDASNGGPVDLLEPARVLGLDLLAFYFFRHGYPASLQETNGEESAIAWMSLYLDAGQLFRFPSRLYDMLISRLGRLRSGKDRPASSAKAVHEYLLGLPVDGSEKRDTYQGRLHDIGVPREQIAAECKDLLFAGIHSFGAVLAITLWHLAKNPATHERLCAEIQAHRDIEPVSATQHLPYLSAVIKEGLRLAPVNGRLPRIVPAAGWTVSLPSDDDDDDHHDETHYHLPARTIVGVSTAQLLFNPHVFHDPMAFAPERWLQQQQPSLEMQRDFVPFSVGSRGCLAKNLSFVELGVAVLKTVDEGGLLQGVRAKGEVVFREWFNTAVEGDRVDVVWERDREGKE